MSVASKLFEMATRSTAGKTPTINDSKSQLQSDRQFYEVLLQRVNHELGNTSNNKVVDASSTGDGSRSSSRSNSNSNSNSRSTVNTTNGRRNLNTRNASAYPSQSQSIQFVLNEANEIANKLGLTTTCDLHNIHIINCSTLNSLVNNNTAINYNHLLYSSNNNANDAANNATSNVTNASHNSSTTTSTIPVSTTTGGYSNTDHIIVRCRTTSKATNNENKSDIDTNNNYNSNDGTSSKVDDRTINRLYEYRRQYMIRHRNNQRPNIGSGHYDTSANTGSSGSHSMVPIPPKWDKPYKVAGERRRRITPYPTRMSQQQTQTQQQPLQSLIVSIPPEPPPPSGYIIFLGQMTTKIRYCNYFKNNNCDNWDNPTSHDKEKSKNKINPKDGDTSSTGTSNRNIKKQKHDQSKIVQDISKIWNCTLSDHERDYYSQFYAMIKKEYSTKQYIEYRATGHYTASNYYIRHVYRGSVGSISNNNSNSNIGTSGGLWMHVHDYDKNSLEMELTKYMERLPLSSLLEATTMDDDEGHAQRIERIEASKVKRKIKLRQEREQQEEKATSSLLLSITNKKRRTRNNQQEAATSTTNTSSLPKK